MLTRLIWGLMPRREVFNILLRKLSCQDPGFEESGPFCQESARNLLSKHRGKVLVNLQKKFLKSLQPSTHFQYVYLTVGVIVKCTLFTLKINNYHHMHFLPSQVYRENVGKHPGLLRSFAGLVELVSDGIEMLPSFSLWQLIHQLNASIWRLPHGFPRQTVACQLGENPSCSLDHLDR